MDPCLEKVVFPDDRVEEGLHVDPAVLIPIELQEGRGAEEVPEFQGELGSDCQEGVVVEPLLVVVRRRDVLLEELVQLF